MIHETMMELKKTDERIKLLNEWIDDVNGMKAWVPSRVPSSGIGRLTENQAIRLAELKDDLSQTWKTRMQLSKKMEKEKTECEDDLFWELMWDHFYRGFSWKKTAERHDMKESTVKMRFIRLMKKLN